MLSKTAHQRTRNSLEASIGRERFPKKEQNNSKHLNNEGICNKWVNYKMLRENNQQSIMICILNSPSRMNIKQRYL